MGTSFEVYLYAPDGRRARELFQVAFDEIERIETALSTYRATSEISRINAHAATGPVTTDPEVFQLLTESLRWSRRSGGAFDITVGRLVEAWGFFRGEGRYPQPEELARAREASGWARMVLDEAERSVRFLAPGMGLDLGAVGKGYALDRVARLLRELGVGAALLNAGRSSYFALGRPPDRGGWRIRVPDPLDPDRTISSVELEDASLSTSGSAEQYFELEGRRYSHILDPRTGHPVQGVAQVTVIAATATESDVLSTALFVLGPAKGEALLQEVGGAAALVVTGTGDELQVHDINWPGTVDRPGTRRRTGQ